MSSQMYLSVLMKIIIDTYFKNTFCIMYIYDADPALYLSAPQFLIQAVENFSLDPYQKCRHFLLECEDAGEAFDTIENVIKYDSDGMYNNRKYLIVIKRSGAFQQFFNSTFLTFVRDILIIYTGKGDILFESNRRIIWEDHQDAFKLYTHHYIGVGGNNDPILLDIWYGCNQSFQYGYNLYPDKITNQMGRELRASCNNIIPYCKCDSGFGSFRRIIGNEHNIILKFAQRYNFTLNVFRYKEVGMETGRLFENWTSSGIRATLAEEIEEYQDVLYGGIPVHYNTDMIQSVTYTYEVSVPLPTISYGWLWVFKMYRPNVWFFLIVTYAVTILIIKLRRYLLKIEDANISEIQSLEIAGIYMNQSVADSQELKLSFLLKYIIMVTFFSSMIFSAAYNSRLSSIMVIPVYENDIRTLTECANSDYKLLFFDKYYQPLEEDTREVYKKLYQKIYLLPEDKRHDHVLSEKLFESRKYAVARYRRTSGAYFEDYEHLQQMYGRYKVITPELFTDYYYFLLRKNSMLTVQLNELVNSAIEAGLMKFWEEEGIRFTENTTVSNSVQNMYNNEDQNLNMKNLKGCFAFWGIFISLSVIIFLFEVKVFSSLSLCFWRGF